MELDIPDFLDFEVAMLDIMFGKPYFTPWDNQQLGEGKKKASKLGMKKMSPQEYREMRMEMKRKEQEEQQ